MRILTQNVRCRDDGGENTIPKRAERLRKLINRCNPDIICLQECTPVWMLYIRIYFSGKYSIFNSYRGGDAESLCILWRRRGYSCVKKGKFMLSDNPDDMHSKCYEKRYKCNRITSYALLSDKKDSQEILVADIHFGFDEAERVKSADLTAHYLVNVSDAPTVVAGDMNSEADSPSYSHMLAYYKSACTDIAPTYHGYGKDKPSRIDHIFVSRDLYVYDCKVIGLGEGYVSDHYGVMADIERTE